jgi:hypothetical protein
MELPFLNPWMLFALPAAGIPVLIHLLNRHRVQPIAWGAMYLLRKVIIVRARQLRLEDILLMLLRCLIIFLFLLALARPTTKMLSILGKPDTGVLITLDGSMSMSHRPGVASRFDKGVERVREILRTVEPGRPVTLATLASEIQSILRTTAFEPGQAQSLLKQLRPTHERLNLETGLRELNQLADELKAPHREVHLVTDGQSTTFAQLSHEALSALQQLAGSSDVFISMLSDIGEDNVAVTQFDLSSGVLRAGAIARFRATVVNHSPIVRDAGELSLLMQDRVVDRRFVGRLAPGRSMDVYLYAPLQRAGIVRLTARLSDDDLAWDDSRHAVIHVRSVLRVLCVDGGMASQSDGRGAAYVATALAPPSIERSEVRPLVDILPWTALPTVSLSDYQVVVLVNVPEIPEHGAMAVHRFLEDGGGLILFAGSNVKPQSLNNQFLAAGRSLLPGEVLPVKTLAHSVSEAEPLDLALTGHPIVQPLRGLPDELLSAVRIQKWLRIHPRADSVPVLYLAGGDPLALERRIGRGKVLLMTTAIDRNWSNLAVNPAFPVLLQQAVTHLARAPHEQPVSVPEPLVLPLPQMFLGEDMTVISPDGDEQTNPVEMRGGKTVMQSAPLTIAGFYQVVGAGTPLTVAANIDHAESDVKVLKPEEMELSLSDLPIRVIGPDRHVAAVVVQARTGRELWLWLLGAAAALMVIEALSARWSTQRHS